MAVSGDLCVTATPASTETGSCRPQVDLFHSTRPASRWTSSCAIWMHSSKPETTAAPPDLNPFLPETGEIRRLTLVELIKVDLEYRWLSRGCPKRISEYFAEFPELSKTSFRAT